MVDNTFLTVERLIELDTANGTVSYWQVVKTDADWETK